MNLGLKTGPLCPNGIIKCISTKLLNRLQCAGKGKAIPLKAWTGPEGSRRLRLPDFKTIGT
jgi:hypothetical protein